MIYVFFFFKQKTAYEISVRDWSSDVCSSDLGGPPLDGYAPEESLRQGVHEVGDADAHPREPHPARNPKGNVGEGHDTVPAQVDQPPQRVLRLPGPTRSP